MGTSYLPFFRNLFSSYFLRVFIIQEIIILVIPNKTTNILYGIGFEDNFEKQTVPIHRIKVSTKHLTMTHNKLRMNNWNRQRNISP